MRKPFVLGKLTLTSAQILLLESPRPSAPALLEVLFKSARDPISSDPVEIPTTVH